ncbi:MAG TPA: cobalt-precorrin 5A hydrolase [Candidatus Aquicultor sp.]|jgi:cobalt-precorrin 5A hydrolase
MKIAVFAVTENGERIANNIDAGLNDSVTIYKAPKPVQTKVADTEQKPPWLLDAVRDAFARYDALVFVSATGIAVRAIAPHIQAKTTDPAVIVVDDTASFAISLLSGHVGGANALTMRIAGATGAVPVITTATDRAGLPALDLFTKDMGFRTGDMAAFRSITAAILRGESACVFTNLPLADWDERLRKAYDIRPLSEIEPHAGAYSHIVIVPSTAGDMITSTDEAAAQKIEAIITKAASDLEQNMLVLQPRQIYVGIGCRRGVAVAEVQEAIEKALDMVGLHAYNVRGFASIDIKRDEAALSEAAKVYNVDVVFFPASELDAHAPGSSDFVRDTVGTGGVCEPAAILASKGGALILPKTVFGRVTVAMAEAES